MKNTEEIEPIELMPSGSDIQSFTLTDPDDVRVVRRMLQEGVVHFWFRKNDGSVRKAFGTLNMDIIKSNTSFTRRRERIGVLTYWDLAKEDWRSVHLINEFVVDMSYMA